VSDLSKSLNESEDCGKVLGDVWLNQVCERVKKKEKSLSGGKKMIGGIGLLCDLEEKRFMEEVEKNDEK
jgi:hypothetical protein